MAIRPVPERRGVARGAALRCRLHALPARLQRFAAGRALLLAVVAMLLWSVALLAVGGGWRC
ncbi:hypothetical protein P4200_06320 [Pseudomonas aeruginosa]|nr:hypothetical protein [Pseudomonas aeruginosa]